MKYDFTSLIDRHGMDAMAVDLPEQFSPYKGGVELKPGFDMIPMWVADMNFSTVPTVAKEMIARAEHAAFGYFVPTDEYFGSVIAWQETRNGVSGLTRECIGYENGVLGGVISAMRVLCSTGDKVLLNSPTYIGFTQCLRNNGYDMVLSPLFQDENGVWRMDFEDMERRIKKDKIHTAIFCSPYNPCGRVWERWEIERAMNIFEENGVYVISDEIWSDIIMPGHRHIPTQSVSDYARTHTVALYAPSKTFNLAGLVGSYHIIYDRYLRERVEKEASLSHYNSMNVMSMHALIGAYRSEGYEWVDELCRVLDGNIAFACSFIRERFEGVSVFRPEGTYMLFLDCTQWCEKHAKSIDELENAGYRVGVVWQDGRAFHGPCHIRMNLALPLSRVEEAFRRLDKYVFNAK